MDEETKFALIGSIKKWQAIADGTGEDRGPYNCPLCKIFNTTVSFCRGCPIKETTKRFGCERTPYEEWCNHLNYDHGVSRGMARCQICLRIARKEVRFLKRILDTASKEAK